MASYLLLIASIASIFSFNDATSPELRIVPHGDSVVRALGHSVILRCEVIGIGPQQIDISLRWFDPFQREILENVASDRSVYVEQEEDSPTKKLYLLNIRNEYAGTYTCSGQVEGNLQTQRISLLIYKEITFDYAPSPQHPKLGSTAQIGCRVSGTPIPTVSWRYRGHRIQNNGRYAQDVYGLSIKNITKDDDGLYYCRAEVDSDGRYNEKEINVIVHIPPVMVTRSESLIGIQSHEMAIECQADGLPAPKYEFTKEGSHNPLHSTDRRYVDVDSGTIHFRPLQKEDEGKYLCNASNNVGEDFGEITLTVQIPPTIFDLKNMTQSENHATTLLCQSYGDPAPDMWFQKAGNPDNYTMGDNEGGRITMSNPNNGELQLLVRNLVPEDMSNYTCRSSNVAGFHERNGTITVNFKPRFPADHIQRIYTWPGKLRNMTCFSLAEPMPVIEWIRYDYPLFDNETYRVYNLGKNSNLQVRVREADQLWIYGNYTCRVRNQMGQSDLKIDLHKASIPGPPSNVTIIEVTSDTVLFHVTLPIDNGGVEVIQYRVEYEEKILDFYTDDRIFIDKLRASTTFIMRVRAKNEVGLGEPYSITVVTENVRPPSKLAINSPYMSSQPYEYRVTWDHPITGGRPIREYEFKFRPYYDPETYKDRPSDEWTIRVKEVSEYETVTFYDLNALRPQTTYELEATARNDLGWSPPNDPFQFRTEEGDPLFDACDFIRPGCFLYFICFVAFFTTREMVLQSL